MPKPKKSKTAKADVAHIVTDNADREESLLLAAESCLVEIAEELDKNPSSGFHSGYSRIEPLIDGASDAIFRAVGWDDDRVVSEVSRMFEVLKLKRAAGTEAALAAAAAAADEAKETRAKTVPELEKKVAELVAQIEACDRAERNAIAALDAMNLARKRLRSPNMVPEFIRRQCKRLRVSAAEDYGKALSAASTRVTDLKMWIQRNVDEPGIGEWCNVVLPPDHPVYTPRYVDERKIGSFPVNRGAFLDFQEQCKRDLPAAEEALVEARKQFAAAQQDAEEPFNYYLDED